MLLLLARGDQEAVVVKGYSAFPKAPASLEPHHQIVYCYIQDTCWGWGLTEKQLVYFTVFNDFSFF